MPVSVRLRNAILLPLMTMAVILGLTSFAPAAEAAASGQRLSRAASVALQQVGDPYRYGAAGPSSFDCSGLMQYSYRRAGISLPRTAASQARRARHISRSSLRRGDLIFFTHGSRVYHAAMFLRWSRGKVVMLHSPGTGKRVRVDRPWTNSWFAGTLR